MPRPKGLPKTGGKKRGHIPKERKELRKLLKDFAVDNFNEFKTSWGLIMEPEKKCKVYIDACKYVLPSLSSIDLTDSDGLADRYVDQLIKMRDSDKNS